jgi:hypothetical protein
VSEVTAGERGAIDALLAGGIEPVEVFAPALAAARRDTIRHILNGFAHSHLRSF